MKILKNPISRINNLDSIITLLWGDKTYAEAYKKLGWNLSAHNGIDLVPSSNSQECYGSPIYATQDGVVQKVVWEGSTSTKGNGITIEGLPFVENGAKILLCEVHWHLSDVLVNAGDFVKAGQMIGKMGNSGFTTGTGGFGGTHLHFMVYPYVFDGGQWKLLITNTLQGADNPENWLEGGWAQKGQICPINKLSHISDILSIIQKTINFLKGRVK